MFSFHEMEWLPVCYTEIGGCVLCCAFYLYHFLLASICPGQLWLANQGNLFICSINRLFGWGGQKRTRLGLHYYNRSTWSLLWNTLNSLNVDLKHWTLVFRLAIFRGQHYIVLSYHLLCYFSYYFHVWKNFKK